MAASRKVNDFWVAPILLENMREEMVQVDAWFLQSGHGCEQCHGQLGKHLCSGLALKAYLELLLGCGHI